MIQFPCKFGDEYPVEPREGIKAKFKNAYVCGIKITPAGTEVTLLVPVGTPDTCDTDETRCANQP